MKVTAHSTTTLAISLLLSLFLTACSQKQGEYEGEYEDTVAVVEDHIIRLGETRKGEQRDAQNNLTTIISNNGYSPQKRIKLIRKAFPDVSFEFIALRKALVSQSRTSKKEGLTELYKKLAECYEKGDGIPQNHYAAISYYYYVAEDGDVDAQSLIANAYFTGDGLARNITEAINWYTRAAEQGHAESQVALWKIYEEGIGVPQNFSLAAKWMTEAAGKDNYEAQLTLWKWYMAGKGVSKNMASAAKWMTKTAEKGDLESQYTLAALYKKGEGVTQDIATAAKWYLKAAEQGHAESQTWTGVQYYTGDVVEKNYEEAVKWFTKAAEQGDLKATAYLGVCYFCGNGVQLDYEKAMEQFKKICRYNENDRAEGAPIRLPEIYYLIGHMNENGLGVVQSVNDAFSNYSIAAEENITEAQWCLARFYDAGIGCESAPQQAYRYYQKCAQKGIIAAKYFLANCYFFGTGVSQDPHKALKLYNELAQYEIPEFQYSLGYCYYYGEGGKLDPTKGVEYFRKAATSGHIQSQTAMGNYYYLGNHTARNPIEAVSWYREAAIAGNAEAQVQLGFCYLNGDGVKESAQEAQIWFNRAAANNYPGAKEFISLCYSETLKLESNQPIIGYSQKKNSERTERIKDTIELWCNKHTPMLMLGNFEIQNGMISDFKEIIKEQYNCQYENQIDAYNTLNIRRGPALKKIATDTIASLKEFQVDFNKIREEELGKVKRKYPLYKLGKYVHISFMKGNMAYDYSGIFKPGGLERLMIGQRVLRYDDIPINLRARFIPTLNEQIVTKEVNAFMEDYEKRFNKRRDDAIQVEYTRLATEQSKLLNNSGMVWVDNELEWRTPSELVEPEISQWRQKMRRRLQDSVLEVKGDALQNRWEIIMLQRKIALKALELDKNSATSFEITITEQRNKAEQLRRRNAVFTKEQMRPTKWSTSDPIFISAFNTL